MPVKALAPPSFRSELSFGSHPPAPQHLISLGSAAEKGVRLSRTPVRSGLHEQIAGRGLRSGEDDKS